MDEDVEVQLLDFRCHDVRDDLLDGLCSQPDLAEAVVLELADDEVVAVLLVLLDADDLPVLLALLYGDVADAQFESLDALDEPAEGRDVELSVPISAVSMSHSSSC